MQSILNTLIITRAHSDVEQKSDVKLSSVNEKSVVRTLFFNA